MPAGGRRAVDSSVLHCTRPYTSRLYAIGLGAMYLIRGIRQLASRPAAVRAGSVATIGNFDGVHRGHQAVLARVVERARALRLPAVAISFEPHPREYFAGRGAPPRLTSLRCKFERMRDAGIDALALLHFDSRLAGLEAEAFVRSVFFDGLGVRHLVVGDDFRFGRDRRGDHALLVDSGRRYGFEVEDTPTVLDQGERISSTAVRDALAERDLDRAERLLGWRYSLGGRVRHGNKQGRELGYPTANIGLYRNRSALAGIFAARVHGLTDGPRNAVASLGARPTVEDSGAELLEVHLFDFSGSLYGERIEVEFRAWLRDIERFDSLDALKHQIDRDAAAARRVLAG